MRPSLFAVVWCATSLFGSVLGQNAAAAAFATTEAPIAKASVLANIGSAGSKSQGAKPGIVIASPSTTNPNYLFTWTRDSSLVFKMLIDQYTTGIDTSLLPLINSFFTAEQTLQQVSNPSGSVSTGGLGEPKFNIDETAFTGAWGRPQRDGPALRATAMITWANSLLSSGNTSFVSNTLWPVIKLDLDYVAGNWNQSTFDLWEEVDSSSFFTTAVQHRSMRDGAALATRLGGSAASSASSYTSAGSGLLCFLQSYWNPSGAYVTANTGGGRSGKDANTVLASIHTFDKAAGCDATTFQPCSDKALSNLKVYVDSFRSIYGINSGIASNAAVATGRYPEDVYFNGNPWYLATLAVAEQLYDSLIVWDSTGSLTVTSTSLAFFQQFLSSVTTGTYTASSSQFETITTGVKNMADGFVAIVAKYTPSTGGLSEQFDKNSGVPTSAVDLTWSYAAAITAIQARQGTTFASWGAAGLTTTCSAPSSGGGGSSGSVTVNFQETATTVFGENIFIVGSIPQLGNWNTGDAVALNANNYPNWQVSISLPASTTFQYKYIRINNGAVTWESDPNRQLTTPASGSITEDDTWR